MAHLEAVVLPSSTFVSHLFRNATQGRTRSVAFRRNCRQLSTQEWSDWPKRRSCWPRPDLGGRQHAHAALRRAATSWTCDTWSNSTPTRRRSVAVRRHSTHIAWEAVTERAVSQPVADNQSSTSCRPILRPTWSRFHEALRLTKAGLSD